MNTAPPPAVQALLQAQLVDAPDGEGLLVGDARVTGEGLSSRTWRVLAPSDALPADRRFAVGVVADALDALPADRAAALLAGLRDRLCRRVLVLTGPGSQWGRTRMLALGYTLRGGDDGWRLYDHDIASYNPERSWNNPSDWAHPENYHRNRW